MSALTIEIPYLGAYDIGEIQTAAPSGASGGGAVIGAAAGSVVPGAGTAVGAAVGALIEQLGGMVKGKTQTFEWGVSKTYADKLSNELATKTQAAIPPADFDRRAQSYIDFVESYLRSSDWWQKSGEGVRIANELRDDVHKIRGASGYKVVQTCLWLISMWILTQSDKARPEELPKFFKTHLEGAYTAYWFVTGSAPIVQTLPPAPGQSNAPSTQALQTTSEEANKLRTYVLVVGFVILIVMTGVVVFKR